MPNPRPTLHRESIAVAAGRPASAVGEPLNQPPVFASSFVAGHHPGAGELAYARDGNPTWQALEEVIGALEGGRTITYASGMAAAHAIVELFGTGIVVVLPSTCYLGVSTLIEQQVARLGWTIRRVDVGDTGAVLAAADGADLVWLESPTNPMIEVADLPAIAAARPAHALLVVDNTFATPLLQRPLECGADIVVHSATKFMSGHSDALLGALVVQSDADGLHRRLDDTRRYHGAVPGVMEAYLVLRGIRTLALRLRQAQSNAGELARRLAGHRAITRVRYPGLVDDPAHEVAARTMDGFGSLISIELSDADAARAVCDATELWVHATSLGGVESTLERRRRWPAEPTSVPEGLLRLSVGIEHVEDLWADLEKALAAVTCGRANGG